MFILDDWLPEAIMSPTLGSGLRYYDEAANQGSLVCNERLYENGFDHLGFDWIDLGSTDSRSLRGLNRPSDIDPRARTCVGCGSTSPVAPTFECPSSSSDKPFTVVFKLCSGTATESEFAEPERRIGATY